MVTNARESMNKLHTHTHTHTQVSSIKLSNEITRDNYALEYIG